MDTFIRIVRGSAGGALLVSAFFAKAPQSYVMWILGAMLLWAGITGQCGFGARECSVPVKEKNEEKEK